MSSSESARKQIVDVDGSDYEDFLYEEPPSTGLSTFIQAAGNGNEETVLSLLNRNEVNVNDKDIDGFTALILAAMNNHERMFSLLIDRGADINSKDNIGWTALGYAEMENNPNIISIIQKVNKYLFLLINNEYIWFIGYFCILILINNCIIILRM